jgi:hypothetical protein
MRWPTLFELAITVGVVIAAEAVLFHFIGVIDLKLWQPLIAALIALGAAGLAYHAAMAKVNFDRATLEKAEADKRRRYAMRLDFALNTFLTDARLLPLNPMRINPLGQWNVADLALEVPTQALEVGLDEAWENLELFDTPIVNSLGVLRYLVRDHTEVQAGRRPKKDKWQDDFQFARAGVIRMIDEAQEIRKHLAPLISPETAD